MISKKLGGRYYHLGLREEYLFEEMLVRIFFYEGCVLSDGKWFLRLFLRCLAVPKVDFSLVTGEFASSFRIQI